METRPHPQKTMWGYFGFPDCISQGEVVAFNACPVCDALSLCLYIVYVLVFPPCEGKQYEQVPAATITPPFRIVNCLPSCFSCGRVKRRNTPGSLRLCQNASSPRLVVVVVLRKNHDPMNSFFRRINTYDADAEYPHFLNVFFKATPGVLFRREKHPARTAFCPWR